MDSSRGDAPGLTPVLRLTPTRRYPPISFLIYLISMSVAEAVTTYADPRIGLGLHALILLSLLVHGSIARHVQSRRFLVLLALAPLLRIMSLAVPRGNNPLIRWYLIVGVLLALATFLAARVTGMSGGRIGLSFRSWPAQILVGLTGPCLGLIEFYILKPGPAVGELSWRSIWLPALIFLAFTGFLEEIVFRGLIQQAALERMGKIGLLYVPALFAVMHLGYRSAMDIVFVFIVGLAFGLIAFRMRSLLGVSLAHGLTNVTLYLIYPFFL